MDKPCFIEGVTISVDKGVAGEWGAQKTQNKLAKAFSSASLKHYRTWKVTPCPHNKGRHFDALLQGPFHAQDQAKLKQTLEQTLQAAGIPVLALELSCFVLYQKGDKGLGTADPRSIGSGLDVLSGGADEIIEDPLAIPDQDKFWPYNSLGFDRCHQQYQGRNIIVAHPDTGFLDHAELDRRRIQTSIDWDFYDNDDTPRDEDGAHGLATGCTLMSGVAGHIIGAAPQCQLVPLRVTSNRIPQLPFPDGVVLFLAGMIRLRNAINYAISQNCDIICMSLGGLAFTTYFTGLHEAIKDARAAGLIVIAAAGNYTMGVDIYPAAFKEVISVAATNKQQKPWSNSAWGDHVNVAAPGEHIFVARVNSDGGSCYGFSNGTSYAAPYVAGIAALWLEKHGGRGAAAREFRGGYQVQDAFLKDLTRKTKKIDEAGKSYGAGLVNAADTLFPPRPNL